MYYLIKHGNQNITLWQKVDSHHIDFVDLLVNPADYNHDCYYSTVTIEEIEADMGFYAKSESKDELLGLAALEIL